MDGAAGAPGIGDIVMMLTWFIPPPLIWAAFEKRFRSAIPETVGRNVIGALVGGSFWVLSFLFGIGFGVLTGLSWLVAVVFIGISAGCIWYLVKPAGALPDASSVSVQVQTPPTIKAAAPQVKSKPISRAADTSLAKVMDSAKKPPSPKRKKSTDALAERFRNDDEDLESDWLSEQVVFDYRNADGIASRREVRVLKAWPDRFVAYCYKRRERRTFRFDRIAGDVVRTETGEVIDVEDWRDAYL